MSKFHRFPDLVASGRVKNRMTLKRWIDAGLFPPPDNLGPNTVGWSDEYLVEYDERVRAGNLEPNPAWLAKAAERKARIAAQAATAPKAA